MLDYVLLWIAAGCLVSPLVWYIDLLAGAIGNKRIDLLLGVIGWPIPFVLVLCDVGYYLIQDWKRR